MNSARFTQPDVLWGIGFDLVSQFLARFKEDLKAGNLPFPDPDAQNGNYLDSVAELLATPAMLPEALTQALLAIEDLALPENEPRLHAALAQAEPPIPFDPDASAEKVALQLWLASAPQPATPELPSPVTTCTAPCAESDNDVNPEPCLPHPPCPGVPECATPEPPPPIAPISASGAAAAPILNPEPCVPHSPNPLTPAEVTSPPPSDNQPSTPQPSINSRRHRGKVGRLPHKTREAINVMICDGLPYAEIIRKLGKKGSGLTYHNLKRWRKGGYKEWFCEQERRDRTRVKEQFALDILREKDAPKLHEAFLQLAASELCQFLADFDCSSLRKKIQEDPRNFIRLLNVLPKLSESGLNCELQRAELAKRLQKLARSKEGAKPGGLSPENLKAIEEALNLL